MEAKRARTAFLLLALAFTVAHAAGADCNPPPATEERAAPLPSTPGLRIGIALGSGSMHGLAHIGVLRELEARGLKVDIVTGTSVGAIVGALWASGYGADEIASLSRGSDWEEAGEFAPTWQGLYSSRGLQVQLRKLLHDRPIEAWPRRFGAVATELASGRRRLIDHGDGALAVQASAAAPVLFAPVAVDGEALADGALVEPVPINAARDLGADFVIAVDVAYRPYEAPASGLVQYGFQAMHVLVNSLAEAQAHHADFRLRMELHERFMACGPRAMIGVGREEMRAAMPALAAALAARMRAPGR